METSPATPVCRLDAVPSMGPPPFGDGNQSRDARLSSGCRPFNGATAFRRWKPVPRRPSVVWMPSLQWGHRLSAMETSSPALPVCCPFAARLLPLCCPFAAPSMGPPPFGDGNVQSRAARLLPVCCPFAARLLPFAAPLLPLCCPFAAPLLPLCCLFNGATAFRRWKRPVPRCPFAVYLLPLQWGHRLSAMETALCGLVCAMDS